MDDNEIPEEEGLIDRIKESPRTVSALIIILIVAAAIYAFSGEEGQTTDTEDTREAITEVTEEEADNNESDGDSEEGDSEEKVAAEDAKDDKDKTTEREPKVASETTTKELVEVKEPKAPAEPKIVDAEQEPVAEAHRTDNGFVEVAEAGNGITHLARRASSRWLSENQAGYAVTDEHRI